METQEMPLVSADLSNVGMVGDVHEVFCVILFVHFGQSVGLLVAAWAALSVIAPL